MSEFRYAQLCPIARAAELLAERWTLVILRELFAGPQRFSDLRGRAGRVSPSVLAQRLSRLERHGVVRRRELPPPAASTVYELAEAGQALLPVMSELARWGMRFLFPARPEDHVEPDWIRMALQLFARRGPAPPRAFEIRIALGSGEERVVHVAGGPGGTHVTDGPGPGDAVLRAPPRVLLALLVGAVSREQALREGLQVEGDLGAVALLPDLFEANIALSNASGSPPGRIP